MRWFRWVLLTIALTLSACLGMFLTIDIGVMAAFNKSAPCVIPGYETVLCQRFDFSDHYVYKVLAVRGVDALYIEFKVSKIRKMLI